jgi:hypothetical protein
MTRRSTHLQLIREDGGSKLLDAHAKTYIFI